MSKKFALLKQGILYPRVEEEATSPSQLVKCQLESRD